MGNGLHAPRRRTDANHTAVVEALRAIGCSVQSIASVGRGCPDLLWARDGVTGVMEVKNGSLPPSRSRLTEAEWNWARAWKGRYDIVLSAEDAVAAVSICGRSR